MNFLKTGVLSNALVFFVFNLFRLLELRRFSLLLNKNDKCEAKKMIFCFVFKEIDVYLLSL